jgi:uncharacterized protein YqjF (DUF2071 family)
MDADGVRSLLPRPLRPFLDTFEGTAWVGVVPFWMSHVRLRGMPQIPGLSTFAEMNVRTYVSVNGKPGVYFFSLDAENLPAVYGARIGFSLAYFHAKMSVRVDANDEVHYESRRLQKPKPAEFAGSYGPTSSATFNAAPGSVDEFLVERYCLYTADKRGRIYRGNIHHLPWPLQQARADIGINNVAQSHGLHLPEEKPLLHFAKQLEVLIWMPERVR